MVCLCCVDSSSGEKEWLVRASDAGGRTKNPLRAIVDQGKTVPNPDKKTIALSIGDPTICGNLLTHETVVRSIADKLTSFKYNGYPPSIGSELSNSSCYRE